MASTQGSNAEFSDTLDGQQRTAMQLLTAIASLTKEIKMLSESVEGLQDSIAGLQERKARPIKMKKMRTLCQDMKSIYITDTPSFSHKTNSPLTRHFWRR